MRWLIVLLSFQAIGAEFIPNAANQYKKLLTRHAQSIYGMNAPIPIFAAQIHKESTWNPNAQSPYASGLTQFTPDTADDVSAKYPVLSSNEPLNPNWAIQALLLYDLDLKTQVEAINECHDWAFTFAMYNGGAGWIWREKNLAEKSGVDRNTYWDAVELFNAGRKASAKAENRGYPKKIIYSLQELYIENEWGYSDICLKVTEKFTDKAIEEIEKEVETNPDKKDQEKKKKPEPESFWDKLLKFFS